MSAHVLLNLLNEFGKRDEMRGLQSILSLFRNEFNKINNTRARKVDSVYLMVLTLLHDFVIMHATLLWTLQRSCKSVNHLWFIYFIAWRYFTPRRDFI